MSTSFEVSRQIGSPSRERLLSALNVACRLLLAATFGTSSIEKFTSPAAFEKVLAAYHLSSVMIDIAVPVVPLLEFALTLTLLFGIIMRTSAVAAAVMLTGYTVLMGVSLFTGNVNHGCGCFISVSNSQSWAAYLIGGNSITIADVIRDILLILVAVAVWITHNPKLGLDKFWTNSRDFWRWYRGRGYLAGALAVVLATSTALAAMAEVNLVRAANTSLSIAQDFNPNATIAIGHSAPDFSLSTVDGTKYTLDAYHGKVVLLEFYAIWCSNCQAEAPIINRIQREFPSSKFQILSVIASPYSRAYETSGETNTALYTTRDIDWYEKTFHVTNPILLDPNFKVTNQYIRQEYPNLIVIDPNGRVRGTYIGPTSIGKLTSAIQPLLP